MQTVVLSNNVVESVNLGVNTESGLLAIGEGINLYTIKSRIPSDSGEAEIYLCEKQNQTYVLKYYFNCKPKTEVIEKLKGFRNPDIVTLYDFGEYKNHFYEVMEYAEGGSLDSKDSDGKYKYLPVDEETAIQIIRETINAFDECHKAGIIHRDIKPGNLFYKNKDGSDILVGDFGISSYYDVDDGMSKHLTQTSARTEGYTAPEVYSGVIGPEVDYYSLGVTLWELLTAKDPFMTVNEKPMFAASIMLETIQGKMADTLIARAPHLSQKMKTLIKGLMTVRHEKRWNHDLVLKFLDGEDVPVYTESNQIPEVTVGETVCTSYKEIATAILADMEAGKSFVYKGGLGRYLVKIDKVFANKISDEIDEFTAKGNLDEGLFSIAHELCPNLEFKLSDKTSFSSLVELINILETKPKEVIPYLIDESKNLYLYLKVIGLGEISKKIWEITKNSSSEYLLISKIILTLNGNSIAPFTDGVNDKIVLSDLRQLQSLSVSLKKRLLLKIDAFDKNVCAWVENLSGLSIDKWRETMSFVNYQDEEMVFSKLDLFNMYVDDSYTPALELSDEKRLFENIKFFTENKNSILTNLIIDRTWPLFFENGKYRACKDLFDLVSINSGGLKHDIKFYKAKRGQCLYELGEYKDALLVLENIDVCQETSFKYEYCALCAFKLNDLQLALAYVNRAIEQDPDNYELLNLKGKTLYELKKYKEAVATLSMAIDIKESREAYSYRAKCYEELAKDGAPELMNKAEADRESAENIRTDFSCEFEKEYGNKKKQLNSMNVVTVGKEKGCDYKTIQQAINSVAEGSTIHVLPGIYMEDLKFTKSVNLVGCEDYIAEKSSGELPVVVFSKNYSCKIDIPVNIDGIVFTQKQKLKFNNLRTYLNKFEELEKPENPGNYCEENFQTILWLNTGCKLKNMAVLNGENYGITFSSGISLLEYSFVGKTKDNGLCCCEKSSPKIKYTNVVNCRYLNVYFGDNTTAELNNCNIYNSQSAGILARNDSECILKDCFIYDNNKEGVFIRDNAAPTITDCEIHDNECAGVRIVGSAVPTVTGCEIHDNKQNGILILDNAKPKIAGCKIHDNKTEGHGYPGVVADGESSPTIRNCEIYNHLSYGLWIKENAGGTYEDCDIHNNESEGVRIAGSATPTVTDCEIHDNKQNGIWILDNAKPEIAGCKIHDNKTEDECYPGVIASGDSSPAIRDCEIYNHLASGLWIKENAGGTYRNCEIYNNKSGGIDNETSKTVDTSSCECWDN